MKKFIAGLIVGLMLTTTVSFAANQGISAMLTDFNFVINGQAKTVSTQPIVYNGTSYLPVRELSNLLGYTVSYDDTSRTITLNNQTPPAVSDSDDQSSVDLTNFIPVRDLNSQYGVGISGIDGSGGPLTLDYNGKSIKTSNYVIIESKIYFPKSILSELGINQ